MEPVHRNLHQHPDAAEWRADPEERGLGRARSPWLRRYVGGGPHRTSVSWLVVIVVLLG